MQKIYPVILCGGSGTRLWPRSRAAKPKPFLPLITGQTLFEQSLTRCDDGEIFGSPLIVAGQQHCALIEQQLGASELAREARIIVEPQGKNTAPAIGLAALSLPEDAVMLVCPSDHHIEDERAFAQAAQNAAALAQSGALVAFGIEAAHPETGYGYIKSGAAMQAGFAVERFVEKPDLETAQGFLAQGGYSWNGGIFCFRAGDFLAELKAHRPQMFEALQQAVAAGRKEGRFFYPSPEKFAQIEGDSIDYAVMENTQRAAMVPVSMGWSDIGNWQALHEARLAHCAPAASSGSSASLEPSSGAAPDLSARDDAAAGGDAAAHGNIISGTGRAELVNCRNVMVESDGPRVSAIGLEDVIIVVDGDEVLVTSAAGTQLVGKLKGASNQ